LKKIAAVISTIGHPLITIPVFFEALLLKHGSGKVVYELSMIIVALFLIATLWVYIKFKNGSYSNFDVSIQKQRKSLYLFTVPLVLTTSYLLYITKQPQFIFQAFLIGSILMFLSFIINFYLKTSLHVSLNIYLATAVFLVDPLIGTGIFIFSIIVAWSRIILKKHTIQEVISGLLIGSISSLTLYILNSNIDILSQAG